jgi:hypothetical protein
MSLKDLISTFAYNLSLYYLHHGIMLYIILILTLVYWSLYKIVKEYSWNNFNKTEGLISVFSNNKILLQFHIYIFNIFIIKKIIVEYKTFKKVLIKNKIILNA